MKKPNIVILKPHYQGFNCRKIFKHLSIVAFNHYK